MTCCTSCGGCGWSPRNCVRRAAGGGAIANVSSFAAVEPDTAFPTSAVFRAALTVCAELFADACAAPTACA